MVKKMNGAGGVPAAEIDSTLPIPPTKIIPHITRNSVVCFSMDGMSHRRARPRPSQTPLKKRRLVSRRTACGVLTGAYSGSLRPRSPMRPVVTGTMPRIAITIWSIRLLMCRPCEERSVLHRRRDQLVHHAGGRIGLPAFVGSDPAQSTLRAARDTIQRLRRLRDHREDGGEVAGERRTSRRRFEPRWRGASDGASFQGAGGAPRFVAMRGKAARGAVA